MLTDEQRARISAGTRAAVAQRRDGTLAARDAKAVQLAWEQRLSQSAIADQLGISPGAVAGILFRARRDGVMPRHPLPRAKAAPRAPAATQPQPQPQPMYASGMGFQWSTTEQRAAQGRAYQHKARMRKAAPLTEAEAARLIAEAEAEGRVTQCPAKFLNAVNGAS